MDMRDHAEKVGEGSFVVKCPAIFVGIPGPSGVQIDVAKAVIQQTGIPERVGLPPRCLPGS